MNEATTRKLVTREEWCAKRDAMKLATLAHYDRLAAARNREAFEAEGWSANACPLCQAYRTDYGSVRCYTGCPVYLSTRREWCSDTPWMEMNLAIRAIGAEERAEPLPEVLAMREYLAGLDWHRHPCDPVEVTLQGAMVTVKGR